MFACGLVDRGSGEQSCEGVESRMIGLNSVFNSRGSSLMRGLPGSLARRLRQHNLISHRHDPSRPAIQSCGSSGHARCANSLTGRLGRIRPPVQGSRLLQGIRTRAAVLATAVLAATIAFPATAGADNWYGATGNTICGGNMQDNDDRTGSPGRFRSNRRKMSLMSQL